MWNKMIYFIVALVLFNGEWSVAAHPTSSAAARSSSAQPAPLEARAIDYSWVEISGSGAALTLDDWGGDDDEGEALVQLPWAFPWYGSSYTQLFIDPNGNVGFEDWFGNTYSGDSRIPSPGTPNNRIAAFYEDMTGPDGGICQNTGAVYTHYDSSSDRLIVQYQDWCSWEDLKLNTFEILLYPDGRVVVQYKSVPSAPSNLSFGYPDGDSAVGVEAPGGLDGYRWTEAIQDGVAWTFISPGQPGLSNSIYLPVLIRPSD